MKSFMLIFKRIFGKIKREGEDTFNRTSVNLFGTEMTDKEFLRKIWGSEYKFQNSEELQKHFRERISPKFFIDSSSWEEILSIICKHFPDAPDKIITDADKICEHIFDLLGSGEVGLGKKIDWHRDFKTGYRWDPKKYYKDIKIPCGKADIKIPWELSRFQYLITLGQAYWIDNQNTEYRMQKSEDQEKYAVESVNQIKDWIESNPSKFGVNWACTMDVAIRACNWISGYYFFKDSPEVTDEFLLKFLKSIYQHGRHIMSNLECSGTLTSNHYLSDIAGLVYIGVMFLEFKEAKRWRDFAIQELVKEMSKQVYEDGCDFEGSTCYHRLVLELFFFSTLLVVTNDNEYKGENYREVSQKIFGKEYIERLYKMFEAVLYLLKPNGKMPQIGDNDNGRLHIFVKGSILDMRYLLAVGSIFFKEAKFKIGEFGLSQEALWIFGERGYRIWQELEKNSLINIDSKAFPDAGWYVMRNDKNYCIISCGPNGQNGNGGHAHNDKLSFELCIDGNDTIIDPGTYVYTSIPAERNNFRSTTFHNTVVIDNEEQNRIEDRKLFRLREETLSRCAKWNVGDEFDIFIGQHNGYAKPPKSVIHKRQIKFYKKRGIVEIEDKFYGKDEHCLEFNLILSPAFKSNLDIKSERLRWDTQQFNYSPQYGVVVETIKYYAKVEVHNYAEFKFTLQIA